MNKQRIIASKRVSAPTIPSYNVIQAYKRKKNEVIEESSSDEDVSYESNEDDSSEEARRIEKKTKT